MSHTNAINLLALAVVVCGLLAGFWPIALVGVVLAALFGNPSVAVVLGLFLDLLYGTPTGVLRFAIFPLTLCAVGIALVRGAFKGKLRKRMMDTL